MKPAMRDLENILGGPACTDGQLLRINELDIDRETALVHKFAPEPLIEDVRDWIALTTKLNSDYATPTLV
jgi:hypothetical protein